MGNSIGSGWNLWALCSKDSLILGIQMHFRIEALGRSLKELYLLSCPGKAISSPAWVSDTRQVLDTIRPVGLREKEEECLPLD